jgi:type II secretory pathway component PulJ
MTLADLLVSIAVLGLLLGAMLTTLEQGQRAWAIGAARVETQQSARAALAWLSAELRVAGRGPGPRQLGALTIVEPARVALQLDRDGAGSAGSVNETITWRLAADVLRRDAGGGGQPVVNGVRGLALTYLDERGAPTTEPAAVRRVRITLATRPDHAVTRETRDLGAVFTTEVHLRNH